MLEESHFHFIGIGGIGMSAIALALLKKGFTVSGCDNLVGGDLDNVSSKVNFVKADCEDLNKMKEQLDIADKIDSALPMVRDLETLDSDMDNYAGQAMNAFKDLMDLGQNVEDRHAAGVFDVASKMMTNAITYSHIHTYRSWPISIMRNQAASRAQKGK